MGKVIIGSILGGIVAFGWGALSWMVFHLHDSTLNSFTDEMEVAEVVIKNAEKSGIYLLPAFGDESMPFIFASIRKETDPDYAMWRTMLRAALASIASAIVIGTMLHFAAPQLNYLARALFVGLGGLFVAFAGIYPNNIWWEFSVPFTLVGILDAIVGWFLAGLAMAAVITGKAA